MLARPERDLQLLQRKSGYWQSSLKTVSYTHLYSNSSLPDNYTYIEPANKAVSISPHDFIVRVNTNRCTSGGHRLKDIKCSVPLGLFSGGVRSCLLYTSVKGESMSAGRLYDKIGGKAKGKIVFVTDGGVICKVISDGKDKPCLLYTSRCV